MVIVEPWLFTQFCLKWLFIAGITICDLQNNTQRPWKILPLFVFSLAVKFSYVNVVFATKAGVCYIPLVQKL